MHVQPLLSGGVEKPSPWHPWVQTSSPCHHCSDGKVSGCLEDEGRGEKKAQGCLLCSSVSRLHTHTCTKHTHNPKYTNQCMQTTVDQQNTHAYTHTYMLSNLRTGGLSARGQGYPSSDVLFLHEQRDNERERECYTTVWLHRFLSYQKTLL